MVQFYVSENFHEPVNTKVRLDIGKDAASLIDEAIPPRISSLLYSL